jgi:hypothetical protein
MGKMISYGKVTPIGFALVMDVFTGGNRRRKINR